MSRRSEWRQIQQSMFGQATTQRSVQERESIPEIACSFCRNFSENAYASDGRGSCKILKMGSDIGSQPPLFITEGETGLITFFNTNATKCKHFIKLNLIDKDGNECADPEYRRVQRQMDQIR